MPPKKKRLTTQEIKELLILLMLIEILVKNMDMLKNYLEIVILK